MRFREYNLCSVKLIKQRIAHNATMFYMLRFNTSQKYLLMNLVVQLQDVSMNVMEGKWIILKAQICSSKKTIVLLVEKIFLAYAEAVSFVALCGSRRHRCVVNGAR